MRVKLLSILVIISEKSMMLFSIFSWSALIDKFPEVLRLSSNFHSWRGVKKASPEDVGSMQGRLCFALFVNFRWCIGLKSPKIPHKMNDFAKNSPQNPISGGA